MLPTKAPGQGPSCSPSFWELPAALKIPWLWLYDSCLCLHLHTASLLLPFRPDKDRCGPGGVGEVEQEGGLGMWSFDRQPWAQSAPLQEKAALNPFRFLSAGSVSWLVETSSSPGFESSEKPLER